MFENSKIEIRNGVPFVVNFMTLEDEPIEIERAWPLPAATGQVNDGDEVSNYMDGSVLVKPTKSLFDPARWFPLPEGGATEADMVEREVPRPKSKLNTRWKGGQWEREMKSGWKPFPKKNKK